MSNKLVNKHIIRAISLGLTAVMVTSPMTALAAENGAPNVGPVDPDVPTTDVDTQAEAYQEAVGAVEVAQDIVEKAAVVANSEVLESVVTTVENNEQNEDSATVESGEQITYENVTENVNNAGEALSNAETNLIQAEASEQKADVLVTEATNQIENSSNLSEAVGEANKVAGEVVEGSDEVVKEAAEAESSEAMKEYVETVEKAVEEVKAAQAEAQANFEKSEAELQDAYAKLIEAEKNLKAAQDSIESTDKDIDKAMHELEEAREAAKLLQEKVNADAETLRNSKEADLKKAYDQMRATAEGENFVKYDGEASTEDGVEDNFVKNFGDEVASTQYWKDSLAYFMLYIQYVYDGYLEDSEIQSVTGFNWVDKAENPTMNNAYVVTYVDKAGDTVTKYYNYHLADTEGNIDIYEKVLGEEDITIDKVVFKSDNDKYLEVTDENKADFVEKLDEAGNVTGYLAKDEKVDSETVLEVDEKVIDSDSIRKKYKEVSVPIPDVNGSIEADISEQEVDNYEALKNIIKDLGTAQYVVVKIGEENHTLSSEQELNDLYNDLQKDEGHWHWGSWGPYPCYKQHGEVNPFKEGVSVTVKERQSEVTYIEETVIADYSVTTTTTETKKYLDGTKSYEKPSNVNSIADEKDHTRKIVREFIKSKLGIDVDWWDIVVTDAKNNQQKNGDYNVYVKGLGNSFEKDFYVKVTGEGFKLSCYMTYEEEVTHTEIVKDATIEKNYYTYTTYAKGTEKEVVGTKTYWEERKDSTNDADISCVIDTVTKELEIIAAQQKEAEKAVVVVQAAEQAVEEARKKLESLQVDAAGYKLALVDYNEAKAKLEQAEQQLAQIQDKVAEAEENVKELTSMIEAKEAEEAEAARQAAAALGSAQETDDSTLQPTQTLQPTALQAQAQEEGAAIEAVAGQGVAGGDTLVAIADEEVPLADGNQGVADDEEDSTLTIEEEEVPLAAAPVAKEKMSWWWLLIVALMGATGYEMYKKHQEKKELKNK